MRADPSDAMTVLASGIAADEASATQLAWIAALADEAGEADMARALRRIARGHRVRALELEGRLAAVSSIHGGTLRHEFE